MMHWTVPDDARIRQREPSKPRLSGDDDSIGKADRYGSSRPRLGTTRREQIKIVIDLSAEK